MRKSVSVYRCFEQDTCEDRITLSDGIAPAAQVAPVSAKYFDRAFLPRRAWRRPTAAELSHLVSADRPTNYQNHVGVLKIPAQLMQNFKNLEFDQIETRQKFYERIESAEGQAAVEAIAEFVRGFLVKPDEFRIIRIFNEPGLPTTAYVHELDRYVGLHVDNLRGQPIYGRELSSNRISVNLGREDRYLLFINLTMNELIELMEPESQCSPDELVLSFLETHPAYPVVRVKLRPGEAYIAPTQNLIHDGIGPTHAPDFNLTICGHIRIPESF